MSFGYNQCYASCPPTTVTIQPPPFVLSIPGPSLYCPDRPLGIEQYNPCAAIPYHSEGRPRGYGSFSGFYSTSVCSQKGKNQSECGPCQRF